MVEPPLIAIAGSFGSAFDSGVLFSSSAKALNVKYEKKIFFVVQSADS